MKKVLVNFIKSLLFFISGCDQFCSVDIFYEITKPYTWPSTWQDWYVMCDSSVSSSPVFISASSSKLVLGNEFDDVHCDED